MVWCRAGLERRDVALLCQGLFPVAGLVVGRPGMKGTVC
jgi:hypothetical protein